MSAFDEVDGQLEHAAETRQPVGHLDLEAVPLGLDRIQVDSAEGLGVEHSKARGGVAWPMMMALHEVALLRLVAQRIAGPGFATATEAVRWMAAVQAQDHNGALLSVALRTSARSRQGVEDALDAGEVVKSWPMRGTLHLVVAEDLPWMLDLLAPRVVAGAAARRAQLDLDIADLEHAREVVVEALEGGGRLMREELLAVWDQAGLTTAGQRGYHMLWHLAQTGTLCFGPLRNGQQHIVLVDEWIPCPRRLERQEALGELALRYFRSHGPVVCDGEIVGTWKHAGRGAKRTVKATPFTSFPDDVAEAVTEAYAVLP